MPEHDIIRIERRMNDEQLAREYLRSQKDGFGRGWPAGAERLDAMANELISRGIESIRTIFGSIQVRNDWQGFQRDQRAAIATRGR